MILFKPVYTKFIFAVVVFNFLLAIIIAFLSNLFFAGVLSENTITWDSTAEEFVVVVLIGPVMETLFFQVASYSFFSYVIKGVKLGSRSKRTLFILSSSLLFAAFHQYNWLYCISAFLGGLSLNYSYLYFKKQRFFPFLSVVIIHSLYNLLVFIVKNLFAE